MDPLRSYTYCLGPVFVAKTNITTKTLISLIDALVIQFGDGYTFEPEPISGGGILMTHWPGMAEGSCCYKTFRFVTCMSGGRWPWIVKEKTLEQWRSEPESVIWQPEKFRPPYKFRIFLKAFYGAPVWTKNSIEKVTSAFASIGISHLKSSVPSNKAMCDFGGSLGNPSGDSRE
jgi:hypothetical protein